MTKWSLGYQLLRYYVKTAFYLFYYQVAALGKKNIPKRKPVIFAPNHQNALMDPLAIIFTNPKQTVFLTRADIFNNPLLLKIFTFLKMLPVYRIRDGAENLKNNERIFNKSVEILEANASIALFPEATHTDKRRLRSLKKAVPRIAFMAEEKNNFELDLHIVPVGIYYEDYVHSNSRLLVNYGESFTIHHLKELYNENPQKAYAVFRDTLSEKIKELIIHIEDLEHYHTYEQIRLFYRQRMKERLGIKGNRLKNDFKADMKTIALAEKAFLHGDNNIEDFGKLFNRMEKGLKKTGLQLRDFTDVCLVRILFQSLILFLTFPVFLYGFVNGILYYVLSMKFIKGIRDKQFHSSIKFGIGALVGPVLFLIQALIFWAVTGEGWWAFYYYLSLPISAVLANKYRFLYTITIKKWKIQLMKWTRKKEYQSIKASREALIKRLDKILK